MCMLVVMYVQDEQPADKELSADTDQGEDGPDALVVEQHYLQNWDPVSIKIQSWLSCFSSIAVLEGQIIVIHCMRIEVT